LDADNIDMTSDKDLISVFPVGNGCSAVSSGEESVVGSAVDSAAGSASTVCMAARRVEMELRHLYISIAAIGPP